MTDIIKEAQKALDKVKIQLMLKSSTVFFTTVCFSLKHLWDSTIETAETNGGYIKYNPEFFLSLSKDHQLFVVLHETLHVVFMHMFRLGSKNLLKFNMAADYVINIYLKDKGFSVPDWAYCESKYRNMTTEQVYELIRNNPKSNFKGDIVIAEGEAAEEAIKDILIRAATQAKMRGEAGTIPSDIQIYLDKLLTPKLPMKVILNRWLTSIVREDYSYKRPNHRYMPDWYMPSLYSDGLADIAVAIDTSGSVSDSDFQRMLSEVVPILTQLRPKHLTLLQFDTTIKSVDILSSAKDLQRVKFSGRGGTDIGPVLEWVKKNKPTVALVFTDGDFTQPDTFPASNLVWIIHDNPKFSCKKGKVVYYEA